jgi:outer membrane protein TolC
MTPETSLKHSTRSSSAEQLLRGGVLGKNSLLYLWRNLTGSNDALKVLYLSVLISAVLQTGCTVGPKYRPPSIQLQPFHNAPPVTGRPTDLSAPPLDTWWTGFQDPELTRIIQRALDQNLDLQAAVTRVEQARAIAKEAGAKRLPAGTLNAQSEAFRQSLESQVGRYSPVLAGFNRTRPTTT